MSESELTDEVTKRQVVVKTYKYRGCREERSGYLITGYVATVIKGA
ncbi:hypothetical protein [Psychroflexus sp. MES1-P1E]|nr:hypothetical protein [Psychroflexus sp. MES1-P1E]